MVASAEPKAKVSDAEQPATSCIEQPSGPASEQEDAYIAACTHPTTGRLHHSNSRPLRVAIAAGGTAGHVNPALALAEELRARGHEVCFFGQERRLEGTLVPQAGFDFFPIRVSGFDREYPWTAIPALARMARATHTIGKHFKATGSPDVAIGFGAYVELPLLMWCSRRNIPCVIHEQNSVPGLANRLMASHARRVCIAFPAARASFKDKVPPDHIVVVGNPVRSSVLKASRAHGRARLQATDEDCVLLIFGGSLGAHHINQGAVALKHDLLSRPQLRIVHSTGKDDFTYVTEKLALTDEERTRWLVLPYIDDMGSKLASADLVLSRAGASSVAEIAALCLPALLVPYPLATADHQTTNAHFLVDAGAARMLPDDAIDTPEFRDTLLGLLDSPEQRTSMRLCAQGLSQASAAALLADHVEEVGRRR